MIFLLPSCANHFSSTASTPHLHENSGKPNATPLNPSCFGILSNRGKFKFFRLWDHTEKFHSSVQSLPPPPPLPHPPTGTFVISLFSVKARFVHRRSGEKFVSPEKTSRIKTNRTIKCSPRDSCNRYEQIKL